MIDIEKIVSDCISVDSVSIKYGIGKYSETNFLRVEIATSPVEFIAEFNGKPISEYYGILIPDDEPNVLYVGKLVADLFDYLYKAGAFDDRGNEQISDIVDEVAKVVNYLKRDGGAISLTFWKSITPDVYKTILREALENEPEPIDFSSEDLFNI